MSIKKRNSTVISKRSSKYFALNSTSDQTLLTLISLSQKPSRKTKCTLINENKLFNNDHDSANKLLLRKDLIKNVLTRNHLQPSKKLSFDQLITTINNKRRKHNSSNLHNTVAFPYLTTVSNKNSDFNSSKRCSMLLKRDSVTDTIKEQEKDERDERAKMKTEMLCYSIQHLPYDGYEDHSKHQCDISLRNLHRVIELKRIQRGYTEESTYEHNGNNNNNNNSTKVFNTTKYSKQNASYNHDKYSHENKIALNKLRIGPPSFFKQKFKPVTILKYKQYKGIFMSTNFNES